MYNIFLKSFYVFENITRGNKCVLPHRVINFYDILSFLHLKLEQIKICHLTVFGKFIFSSGFKYMQKKKEKKMKINGVGSINNGFRVNMPVQANLTAAGSENSYFNKNVQSTPRMASINSYPKNYFLSFGARGMNLEKFYNVNRDRMPDTVKDYIENLSSFDLKTPLEAHITAFSLLADSNIQTVDDVKSLFFDEPLFADLKSIDDTRATTGLLYEARIMRDTLDSAGETVVNSGEDLTLYLLKKAFLEVKSLADINEDLDKDINPVFKREDKNYINYSTLSALGIKLPSLQYLNSLRTTDEEYSAKIGGLISNALRAHYAAVPKVQGDRTNSGLHKASFRAPGLEHAKREVSKETREKQREAQIRRWDRLSDAERTELINKMQSGNEFQRVFMTDAWNHCPQIRKDLSEYLIRHNMNMPENLIYGTDAYNGYQSEIMTEFWKIHHSEDENSDYSKILGKEIKKARKRAELAEQDGSFSELKKSVYEKTGEIKKEIRELRKTIISKEQRMKEAKEELFSAYKSAYSFLPDSFVKFYLSDLQNLDVESLETWISLLKDEKVDASSREHFYKQMKEARNDTVSREKNAAELAMKTVLYNASKDPSMFNLSYQDLISCLSFTKQMKNYPCNVELKSSNGGRNIIHIDKRPKFDDISNLYSYCIKDIDDFDGKGKKKDILFQVVSGLVGSGISKLAAEGNDDISLLCSIAVSKKYETPIKEEIERLGNVISFACKSNLPYECQKFYADRIVQNAGLTDELKEAMNKIKKSFQEEV